jgi:NhaA family Na+:H+ antiporter
MAQRGKHRDDGILPEEPIHSLIEPLARFLHIEAASGLVLLLGTTVAIVLANSPWADAFLGFWKTPTGIDVGQYELRHSLKHWINDGLMVLFFFVIGLEVKRELVLGELREFRRAILPVAAAIGGMLIPAGVYLALQAGQQGQRGWGIPMATDIAFVIGCIAILGSRVPASLRLMLLSLAIVDDIGAILVIAVGYTEGIHTNWLIAGTVGVILVVVMQRLGVRSLVVYWVLGVLTWLTVHESGIHATIAGVVLGLLTPARPYLAHGVAGKLLERANTLFHADAWSSGPDRAEQVHRHRRWTLETVSPVEYLIYVLHPWVAFLIMPLFALANAGVPIATEDLLSPVAVAVMLGLGLGKPTGIVAMTWLAVRLRIAELPDGITWRHVIGGGFLAGIGFTMALFIAGLALSDTLLREAKVGVLAGSAISAAVGMAILYTIPRQTVATHEG